MILAAVFAIIAAVVEGTFVYDYDIEFKSAAKLTDATSDMNAAPDQPLFLSHETSAAAVLLSRRSGHCRGHCGATFFRDFADAMAEFSNVFLRSPFQERFFMFFRTTYSRLRLHTRQQKNITFSR